MITTLLKELATLREIEGADGVKIFFKTPQNYCIKIIKDDKIIKKYRKGREGGQR